MDMNKDKSLLPGRIIYNEILPSTAGTNVRVYLMKIIWNKRVEEWGLGKKFWTVKYISTFRTVAHELSWKSHEKFKIKLGKNPKINSRKLFNTGKETE